jgi:hypothetical protein
MRWSLCSPSTLTPVAVETSVKICAKLEFVAAIVRSRPFQLTEGGAALSLAGQFGSGGRVNGAIRATTGAGFGLADRPCAPSFEADAAGAGLAAGGVVPWLAPLGATGSGFWQPATTGVAVTEQTASAAVNTTGPTADRTARPPWRRSEIHAIEPFPTAAQDPAQPQHLLY